MKHRKPLAWKLFVPALIALTLVFGQSTTAMAGEPIPQVECEDNGGTWVEGGELGYETPAKVSARPALVDVGPGYNGTCTYPAGNAVAQSICGGPDYILTYQIREADGSIVTEDQACTLIETGNGDVPVYGECGDKQEGIVEEQVTLDPCYSERSFSTFDVGGCLTNCKVSKSLPKDAANALPEDAIATQYVMTRGEDGEPSDASYTVCFTNPDGETVTLYRFISGEWVALSTSSNSPVCATVSGDGAFYLGPVNSN